MNWFLIALLSPSLHAISNHIDKYLLTKYFKGGDTATMIIFSSIFGIVVLPIVALVEPKVLAIQPLHAITLVIGGILLILYLIPYFYALNKDEASLVIPLFQTTPIFGFILAYYVLGEKLTSTQMLASILIILGAIALSLDLNQKIPKLKSTIFYAMLLSSFMAALADLIFKAVAIEESFLISTFWNFVGYSIVGILVLIFFKNYRSKFLKLMQKNKVPILATNSLNEILFIIGQLAVNFASLLAPLALVLVVDGFQPLFVLVYGILITLFFPKLGKESLLKKDLIQKIAAIVVIFIGTYLLNRG